MMEESGLLPPDIDMATPETFSRAIMQESALPILDDQVAAEQALTEIDPLRLVDRLLAIHRG
jgi:hypothetical protein